MDNEAFDVPGVTWSPVSPALVRVRLIVSVIWTGLPVIGAAVLAAIFGGWWLWATLAGTVAVLVWVVLLVPRQVRAISYAELDEDLAIRKGLLFRSLTVVPYGRMQYVDVGAGPLARRAGIATVQLHTASSATDASIPGLPEPEAARLRDRLSEAGEARLAGL